MSTGGDPTRPRGIDVSKWQSTTPSLVGKAFLIARASIGLTPDTRYAQHIAAARKAGVITGAYHFAWREISPIEQAHYFLDRAGNVDLYALDVEGGHAFTRTQTEDFIDAIHARGKTVGLYHSHSGYFDAGQDWRWVAYWPTDKVTAPGIAWDIWQYGSDPTYKPTIIDGNVARDDATLARIAGKDDTMAGMVLTDLGSFAGSVTLTKPWKAWEVSTDKQTAEIPAGAKFRAYATCKYHTGNHPGFLIENEGRALVLPAGVSVGLIVTPDPKPEPAAKSYDVTVGGKAVGAVILP